jgi:hypothetical protein
VRRAETEEGGRWTERRWMIWLSALRIVVLHSRAIQYTVSAYTTFISVYVLYQPNNKAVLASIVIVLLPLAIFQALGMVLVLGRALNIKDIKDVGSPDELAKEVHELKNDRQGKSQNEVKEEIKRELLVKLSQTRARRLPPDLQVEDEAKENKSRPALEMVQFDRKRHAEEVSLDDIYSLPSLTTDLRDGGSSSVSRSMGNMSVIEAVWHDTIGPELEPSSSMEHIGLGPSLLLSNHHAPTRRSHQPGRLKPTDLIPAPPPPPPPKTPQDSNLQSMVCLPESGPPPPQSPLRETSPS